MTEFLLLVIAFELAAILGHLWAIRDQVGTIRGGDDE